MLITTRFLRLLLTITLASGLLITNVAQAEQTKTQSQSGSDSESAESSIKVSEAQLDDLIITLESQTARQTFLDRLKTLRAVEDDPSEVSFSLSEILHIDETSSNVLKEYAKTLDDLGLDASLVTRVVLLCIVILAVMLLLLANTVLSRKVSRNLTALRQRFDLSETRFELIFSGQRLAGFIIALLLVIYAAYALLDLPGSALGSNRWGRNLVEFTTITLFLIFVLVVVWELLNAALEYGMSSSSSLNSGRVETLLPVVRNIVFFAIFILMALVTMSELGIDILPILAGAGVLGIAVGFGAQTMVKDFLTGFTIILEDLIQVGDVVGIGGREGKVERITLRKIQLRNLDGTVHTIPHSEISVVDNMTKEFSYYMMNIGVAYKEDTDDVIACLKTVDEDMRNSEAFGDMIHEPLDILGVDEFADSAVMVKVRTRTNPHDKWTVGREFNRRIKHAFDEKGIEIPFPHRTLYYGDASSA